MVLKKRLISSVIISAAALVASIIMPIVPCRIAPNIPPYAYSWQLCSLNPDTAASTSSIKEYFGYTTVFTDAMFILLLITFTASMIFFHYATKRKKG